MRWLADDDDLAGAIAELEDAILAVTLASGIYGMAAPEEIANG
jgi:hypothetical protein